MRVFVCVHVVQGVCVCVCGYVIDTRVCAYVMPDVRGRTHEIDRSERDQHMRLRER